MNNVNKTLYIPLYGKAHVSKKGIILHDTKAEEIWNNEGFVLKGKAKSKWLAYNMGMRSVVFDKWLKEKMQKEPDAVILHIGCGMDSRIERIGTQGHLWFDVDFPEVMKERKRYYHETEEYYMIESDARENTWIQALPRGKKAIVVMEGVSMYFELSELKQLLKNLQEQFTELKLLMDCYTVFGAKASKYKNPINEVGVTIVHGIDDAKALVGNTGLCFVNEHDLTPDYLIDEYKKVFAGSFAKKIYRLYEYKSE